MSNYDQVQVKPVLFNITVPFVVGVVSILPSFATIFAVVWSVSFNFEASTRSHCQAYNFLPSVSAAIGDFAPQKYVWRICIALHCGPRFILAVLYYGYHTSINTGRYYEVYKTLAATCTLLFSVEICSLVGLSYVSSSDNFNIHKLCFCIFMFCVECYMILTCYLMYKVRTSNGRKLTSIEKQSLGYKKKLCVINIGSFLLALYFYYSHTYYCGDRTYSYFALCEYIVIFSNIGFHTTAMLDFKSMALVVQEPTTHHQSIDYIL
ncbi:post-GPI attachment to proteins factor 2 [Patella vulgata]|uniref:post-GPI attachment to proteins factor 2 n=1 Tax=Patella vulgata TaxID=6465 RepID=UPI0021800F04|nr:post-GPI attachment to proteins factor 2 [Patella vulgata]